MSNYDSFSDSQLIYACREGVDAAWDGLVSRYERLVYTIPRRYGLTQAEVDDVFQSVWLLGMVISKLSHLRGDSH